MTRHRETVQLEMSRTRRQLSVHRGGVVTAVRVEFPEQGDGPATAAGQHPSARWLESLAKFGPTLAGWVEELGIGGRNATIEYESPESTASVFSCPSTTGPTRALLAARLSLAQSLSYSLETATHDVRILWTDSVGSTDASGDAKPAQIHCLITADTEASTTAICNCATRAGLVPVRVVPAAAAMLHAVSTMVLSARGHSSCALVLWVGEHGSVIAAGGSDRLVFARYFPTGTEALVDSLTRARTTAACETPGATIQRSQARELLFTTGIPRPDGSAELWCGLGPSAVVPLIRPVLQRLMVETRQTLRFGLSKGERNNSRILLAGPGASIKRLGEALSSETHDRNDFGSFQQAEPAPRSQADFGSGWCAPSRVALNLLPEAIKSKVRSRNMRRAMWLGIGAAAVAIGIDGFESYESLREERHTLAALQEHGAHSSPAPLVVIQAAAARHGINRAERRIRERMADAPESAALLAALAQETPAHIRLTSIELTCRQGVWVSRVTGIVRASPSASPAASVKAFVDRIGAVPIVAQARLGSTQLGKSDDNEVLIFDLTIELVRIPRGVDGLAELPLATADESPESTGGRP